MFLTYIDISSMETVYYCKSSTTELNSGLELTLFQAERVVHLADKTLPALLAHCHTCDQLAHDDG